MLPLLLSPFTAIASDLLQQGIGSLMGGGGSGGGGGQTQQIENANRAGMFNAAGFTGEAAAADAQNALRKYENTNSAQSTFNQNVMQSLGGQALRAAQGQADNLMRAQSQQAGNTRRDLVNTMRMSGGPAALSADATRNLGAQMTQGNVALAGQLNQNAMQGLSTAGQMFAQSDQMRIADMANRMNMATPHLAQNQAAQGASAQQSLASAASMNQATQQAEQESKYGGLQNWLGYAGGRLSGRGFDQVFGYNTDPRRV